jgi:hypothetical protein
MAESISRPFKSVEGALEAARERLDHPLSGLGGELSGGERDIKGSDRKW